VLGDARSFEQLGSNYTAEQYISAVSAAEEELGARADQAMARLDPEYERQVRETVAELDRRTREASTQELATGCRNRCATSSKVGYVQEVRLDREGEGDAHLRNKAVG
jgi:hypothetical protein